MAKGEDLELDVSAGEGDDGTEDIPKSKKMLFIIIGAVLFVIIATVAGMYFMGVFDGDEASTEKVATTADGEMAAIEDDEILADEPIYWPIEPPFVMNFEGPSTAKYMQIQFTAMSKSKKSMDALKLHIPAVRNELTFLLGAQKYIELNTAAGKAQLRDEIIETINKILAENGATKGIETIYFTSFVMQ